VGARDAGASGGIVASHSHRQTPGDDRQNERGPFMTQAQDQSLAYGIDGADLRSYADLVLRCGVNLEAGQKILITGDVAHAYLIAALAERAYAQGASAAETLYFDDRVLAAKAGGAPTDALAASVPAWYEAVYQTVIDERWARIRTLGDPLDDPYAGVPVKRATALQTAVTLPAYRTIDARINWNLCTCPTPAWARRVYGEPDVARLWRDLRVAVRLDEPDPVAAWDARRDELRLRATRLDQAGFAALRFRGGGTDLFVPLHDDARWQPAWLTTSWGRSFLCNLPSEEIYVSPDFRGVRGTAVVTRPVTVSGALVTDLVLRFAEGRIVEVTASANVDAVRTSIAEDRGACRMGEVALVDASSRVGQLGIVFKETLLDENAACHIAWGAAIRDSFADGLPDDAAALEARGVNESDVHQDVMIGGPEVAVTGLSAAGDEIPVLTGDRWQI
jgi:aminopeptidase